jgi:peptide/nickel transport system permease protein
VIVLFWTDSLFFLLLFAAAIVLWRARQDEHLVRPLRKVTHSRSAMVSAVLLLAYLLVAVLDSIHFTGGEQGAGAFRNEPVSVLDWLLTPLRIHVEKTYSAPFACDALSREMIADATGQMLWGLPRLQFACSHLEHPEATAAADIASRSLQGLLLGGLAGLLLAAPLWGWRGSREWLGPGWLAVILTVVGLGLIAGWLAALAPFYHVLGTDKVGMDVLYQSLKSIRTGLMIGTLTTLVTLPLALLLGTLAGYFRGWVDDVIQYVYTTLNSIPGVLLIAASILLTQVYMGRHEAEYASLGWRADLRLLFLCLILGLTSWTGLCRLLRAETLKLREMEYVQAARALGVGHLMILRRHILPNLMHLVLISVALDFSSLVLAEAVLSYVNIGVDPTTESWGNMINSARLEMAREPVVWWSLAGAFGFMFVLVLAANLLADAVRDAFDPRRAE